MPPPTFPQPPTVAHARIGIFTGKPLKQGKSPKPNIAEGFEVHFNPASLQLTVSNETKKNKKGAQYVASTTAKLSLELQFDTTDTGEDVTQITRELQGLVSPRLAPGKSTAKEPPPPVVLFEWGTLAFKGTADSYKETIDFFSADGVPLRALVSLALSRRDSVFDKPTTPGAPQNAGSVDDDLVLVPADSAAGLAARSGAPEAAHALGAANNQDSLRFGSGNALAVSAEPNLRPPAAFASAETSLGAGAGAGLSLGGSLDLGLGAGAGAGIAVGAAAQVSIGGGAGLAARARLSATEGAFDGLQVKAGARVATPRLDPLTLLPKPGSATVSTDARATFQVGGQAGCAGPSGLRADVGATGSRGGKLTFDPL